MAGENNAKVATDSSEASSHGFLNQKTNDPNVSFIAPQIRTLTFPLQANCLCSSTLAYISICAMLCAALKKKIVNLSAYKFVPLAELRTLRARLLALCKSWELKGTILLSAEGINLFVAGTADKVSLLLVELRNWPGLADFPVKVSETEHQPFTKMLVRIKKEIIAFGIAGINPAQRTSPKLAAKELKQWLDAGR